MTVPSDIQETGLPLSVEYVPGVRGHGVLAAGLDDTGVEAIAVWRLGATDRGGGGAWVLPLGAMAHDPDRAIRIFELLDGRCLIDWSVQRPMTILDRLRGYLPPELSGRLARNILLLPDLIKEIAEQRQRYADGVAARRETSRTKILDLSWSRDLPEDPDSDCDVFTVRAPGAASPVAGEALGVVRAFEQIVEVWRDTEQTRYRRSYLRAIGDPQPLPPRWLARLRAAAQA